MSKKIILDVVKFVGLKLLKKKLNSIPRDERSEAVNMLILAVDSQARAKQALAEIKELRDEVRQFEQRFASFKKKVEWNRVEDRLEDKINSINQTFDDMRRTLGKQVTGSGRWKSSTPKKVEGIINSHSFTDFADWLPLFHKIVMGNRSGPSLFQTFESFHASDLNLSGPAEYFDRRFDTYLYYAEMQRKLATLAAMNYRHIGRPEEIDRIRENLAKNLAKQLECFLKDMPVFARYCAVARNGATLSLDDLNLITDGEDGNRTRQKKQVIPLSPVSDLGFAGDTTAFTGVKWKLKLNAQDNSAASFDLTVLGSWRGASGEWNLYAGKEKMVTGRKSNNQPITSSVWVVDAGGAVSGGVPSTAGLAQFDALATNGLIEAQKLLKKERFALNLSMVVPTTREDQIERLFDREGRNKRRKNPKIDVPKPSNYAAKARLSSDSTTGVAGYRLQSYQGKVALRKPPRSESAIRAADQDNVYAIALPKDLDTTPEMAGGAVITSWVNTHSKSKDAGPWAPGCKVRYFLQGLNFDGESTYLAIVAPPKGAKVDGDGFVTVPRKNWGAKISVPTEACPLAQSYRVFREFRQPGKKPIAVWRQQKIGRDMFRQIITVPLTAEDILKSALGGKTAPGPLGFREVTDYSFRDSTLPGGRSSHVITDG